MIAHSSSRVCALLMLMRASSRFSVHRRPPAAEMTLAGVIGPSRQPAGKRWAALNVGGADDDAQWIRVGVFGDKARLALAKGAVAAGCCWSN
jgi:hypothetical protein